MHSTECCCSCLAQPACLTVYMFCWRFFFFSLFIYLNGFPWIPLITESTKPIFTNFSGLVEIWLEISDLTFVFRSLKGRSYGNHFGKGTNQQKGWTDPIISSDKITRIQLNSSFSCSRHILLFAAWQVCYAPSFAMHFLVLMNYFISRHQIKPEAYYIVKHSVNLRIALVVCEFAQFIRFLLVYCLLAAITW